MKPLTSKLFKVYQRIDGLRVMGFVATAALGNSQVQKTPFRLFVARVPTPIRVGDVIRSAQDEKMLLMEHPSDNEWSLNFKAAHIKLSLPWARPNQVVDPVTGFKTDETLVQMGVVFANFDTPLEEGSLSLSETEYRFLTGEDVKVRDKVGDKFVTNVQRVLGVNLVYAR